MANKSGLPRDEDDWGRFKEIITDLYIVKNEKLSNVIDLMYELHGFSASEKQYKTHFRNWHLAKNFKADEAQLIASGRQPTSMRVRKINQEDLQRRAERSIKRRQARRKVTNIPQSTSQSPQTPPSSESTTPSTTGTLIVAPHRPKLLHDGGPSVVTPSIDSFELLFHKLRFYTHEACVEGRHWDFESSQKNVIGRKALRELSLDLTAGAKYFEEGKPTRANRLWNRALESASKQKLLDTWYYETPIALLFELGRLVHKGHQDIAGRLIKTITHYAEMWLDENDPRRSLFAAFENLEISQLRDGYSSAALSLLEGLATRLEKHNPLLYQFGLHRALDLVWFDPKTDLRKWVVPVEVIDRALGPNTPLSVYFLLLDAYRQVAQKSYDRAEEICSQVSRRLNILQQSGEIDALKIGMAYRRLGRQYYEQKQYDDARRILNQALRFIGPEKHSVLVEIYHLQEKMARIAKDAIDVEFWRAKLQQMEVNFPEQPQVEMPTPTRMGSSDELPTPTTQFEGLDDLLIANMWTSMDNHSSFDVNSHQQPMMYGPPPQVNVPAGYTGYSVPMNAGNTPNMFLNHENSEMRFTEDPEPLRASAYGNQPGFGQMNGTMDPAFMSMNGTFVTPPGMGSGQIFELPEDQSTPLPSWNPGLPRFS